MYCNPYPRKPCCGMWDGEALEKLCWLLSACLSSAMVASKTSGTKIATQLFVWATLIYLVLMHSARAATFDCTKASNFVEKVICSNSHLTSMDDQLGRLYKDALATSSNSTAIKTEQKAWLSARNQCKDSDCIMKAYADRISALSAMSAPVNAGDVTGTYNMKAGGTAGVVLVQHSAGGKIRFYLNATYRANTGELSGEIALTGQAANYVDKDLNCTISFNFARGSLVLDQDGSCGMGLNVSAAGTYKRVSSAPPKFDN